MAIPKNLMTSYKLHVFKYMLKINLFIRILCNRFMKNRFIKLNLATLSILRERKTQRKIFWREFKRGFQPTSPRFV